MTIRLSSGLRTSLVTNYGLGAMLQYGHIRIYSGPQPPAADLPVMGMLLARVSADGLTPVPGNAEGGLELEAGTEPGSLTKRGNWILKGVAAGVPGCWRFVWNAADPDTFSDYYPRLDGAVGDSLILGTSSIDATTNLPVQVFSLILPSE